MLSPVGNIRGVGLRPLITASRRSRRRALRRRSINGVNRSNLELLQSSSSTPPSSPPSSPLPQQTLPGFIFGRKW